MVMIAAFSVALMILVIFMMASATSQAQAAQKCPNAHAQILKIGIKKARTAFYCLLNAERKAAGLEPVESDSRIELAAQRHSQDMVKRKYFAHDAPAPAPYGKTPGDRLAAAGWSGNTWGEAIGGGPNPYWNLSAWLGSKPHCQIIMDYTQDNAGYGWHKGTGTLDMAGGAKDEYVKRIPSCPRKMRTNAAPFVHVQWVKRSGKRLTIRLKTDVKQRVRVEVWQRSRKTKAARVRLNARPVTIRIRLKQSIPGGVDVVNASNGRSYTFASFK